MAFIRGCFAGSDAAPSPEQGEGAQSATLRATARAGETAGPTPPAIDPLTAPRAPAAANPAPAPPKSGSSS